MAYPNDAHGPRALGCALTESEFPRLQMRHRPPGFCDPGGEGSLVILSSPLSGFSPLLHHAVLCRILQGTFLRIIESEYGEGGIIQVFV